MKRELFLAVLLIVCSVSTGFTVAPVRSGMRSSQMMSTQHLNYRLQPLKLAQSPTIPVHVPAEKEISIPRAVLSQAKVLWDFTRPHTIIGSCISIVSLFLFAVPSNLWATTKFQTSLLQALIPSLFVNLYITGVNQVTDVEIDKINKPYLPIAAGRLSKRDGTLIVLASLFLGLYNYGTMDWPLRAGLIGSALLGTLYSVPPFRLKKYPLLAALSILVVRGTLINLGFFLQAKSALLGESLPYPTSFSAVLGVFRTLASRYPESVAAATFFSVFGMVIALMKDVPDIKGDTEHNIRSFSVRVGAEKMFRFSWNALHNLLNTAAFTVLLWSHSLHPLVIATSDIAAGASTATGRAVRMVLGSAAGGEVNRVVSNTVHSAAQVVQNTFSSRIVAPLALAAPSLVSSLTREISPLTQSTRFFVALGLSFMADDVRRRALQVDADEPKKVFEYYMYIWNIFYSCYILLPLLRV